MERHVEAAWLVAKVWLGERKLPDPIYEVDPSRFDRNFGCAKSLELAELRELNAAIAESSSRSCP